MYFQTKWSEKDYRRGPWIQLAADRHRFQRRINEFDSKFGYIFDDLHREYVCGLIRANALIDDFIELNVE